MRNEGKGGARRRGGARASWSALLAAIAVASGCGSGTDGSREYAWVQLGEGGKRIARAITREILCPVLVIDGETVEMQVRAKPSPPAFPVLTCEATIPLGATSASISGGELPLPRDETKRFAVIGDTGCRIEEGHATQDCNDPDAWPFAGLAQVVAELVSWFTGEPARGDFSSLAQSIAELDPDLIVHVGDYLYRESPCPEGDAGCEGSPYGYNWETIEADFFAPAAPLFSAAPLVLTRGNHESCSRAGSVWFRFLDTRPLEPECSDYTQPYAVDVGGMQFIVFDSSVASDTTVEPEQVELYADQFDRVRNIAGERSFLVLHRPMWVFGHAGEQDGQEVLFQDNPTLQAASNNELPAGIQMVLSGHIHLFQLLSFDVPRPPQLVVGNSGTDLDPAVTTPLSGLEIAGATVVVGDTLDEFGFATLEAQGDDWHLTWRDMTGGLLGTCTVAQDQVTCP